MEGFYLRPTGKLGHLPTTASREEKTGRVSPYPSCFLSVSHDPLPPRPSAMSARALTNRLRTTTLQGSFAKLQPQSKDFYEISDHRAVLENSLRHFSCLTEGDNFSVNYNNKV